MPEYVALVYTGGEAARLIEKWTGKRRPVLVLVPEEARREVTEVTLLAVKEQAGA